MIKETITYVDYDGNKRTEDHYFNLSKAELTELQLSKKGGFHAYLTRIINSNDTPEIVKIFKEIITMSYGIKSDDGKKFVKKAEYVEDFLQSEAYSEFLMKIMGEEGEAAKFINGLMPSELMSEIEKMGGPEKAMQVMNANNSNTKN